jgi:type I restriction enzyme S subunit
MDTKKLRQKILDLAIHGKLVPQDPNDEPASVLLKRIREEKERLIKEGKIKRSKMAAKDEIEEPFAIPESWEWEKLEDVVMAITDGDHQPPPQSKTGIPFLVISDVNTGVINFSHARFVSEEYYNNLPAIRKATKSDILFTVTGSYGITILVNTDREFCFQRHIGLIKTINCSKWITEVLQSDYVHKYCDKVATGTAQKTVSLGHLRDLVIPLPPLAEQQRIANEIERWFAAIDELESNEADLQKTIDKVKSKILDLAIHGKLVPQDPNDEPAIELLKRINPKFEACENKLDTCPIPDSWCWAKLEYISTDSADGPFGSNLKKEHYTSNREVRIIQLSNIGEDGWREENTKYTTFEHLKEISRSEVMPNDIVIAKMMPAGRAILCPNTEPKYVLSSDAVKFHLVDSIDYRFALFAINSSTFRSQVYDDVQGVTRVRTSLQKLRKYCIPLPPLAEQKRIVARQEELFAVLDSISAMTKERQNKILSTVQ